MNAAKLPIKVALVEDNVAFLQQWRDILDQAAGFSCVGAFTDFPKAVAGLPAVGADVALVDLRLSSTKTGIDLIREVRGRCLKTQFMIFTVFEEDEHIFAALRAGARSYILKNSETSKILTGIKELHDGEAPMSASIARRVFDSFYQPQAASDAHLTFREIEILKLLAKGMLYKEIAQSLFIGIGTVKQYIHAIYEKLDVNNKMEAVNKYFGKRTPTSQFPA